MKKISRTLLRFHGNDEKETDSCFRGNDYTEISAFSEMTQTDERTKEH